MSIKQIFLLEIRIFLHLISRNICLKNDVSNIFILHSIYDFQCLEYHYKKTHDAYYYFKKWIQYLHPDIEFGFATLKDFPGIFVKDFFTLEKCFNISIKVYTLSENVMVLFYLNLQ